MVSFSAVIVVVLAAVAAEVRGQGVGTGIGGLPSFSLLNPPQAASNSPFGLTIPGLAGSSFSIKSTPASKAIGGALVIEENGIKLPIQLGPAGGIQAEIVGPILPSITDLIKLAQKGLGNFGGILNTVLNQANNVGAMVVNNIKGLLKAVGMPIQSLIKGAGSLLNAAIKKGFITMEKATEIVTSIIQSALSNTLNRFADLVNLLQYAVNKKIILEEQALTLLAVAAQQGVHQISNNIEWSLENFLNATAQAKVINNNVANSLKALLTGNSTANRAAFQLPLSDFDVPSSVKDDFQIDVTVTDA